MNRPGVRPDRPIIGGGGNRPGRPGIGNGNIIIGGGNNIIGGGNINNRPGGDWWSQNHNGNWNNWNNWNGNNWHNHWHDNWHNNCINNRYGWYNGCWNNNWGGGWYAPVYAGVGWGLGSWYSSYAYGGTGYYNPYYADTGVAAYDYSQPVTVNYYSQDTSVDNSTVAPPPPQNNAAQEQFDQGLALFKAGKYRESLPQFDAALRQLPKDPVVHEVRALNLFALGQYQQAAASLNALLATAPGMDWTTMSGLYGNLDDYKQQLRALEEYCKANRTDSPAAFVLAYHYLVNGHQDAAINALKAVVRQQPKDVVAKRMLDSLSPPAPATESTPPPAADPVATAPQTDLVGSWQAKAGDSVIELTIGDDSQFTWKATQKGKPAVELQGGLTASSDMIILESKSQGSMVGRVKSVSPDKWQFAMAGGTPSDAQLTFERTK